MPGRLPRSSFFAGLFVLAFLVFTGCAASGSQALFSQAMPYPSYASAEPVQGLERSTLCHQGRTITIVNLAVDQHIKHGDYFGACSEENRERHEHYSSGQGEPAQTEAPAQAETAPEEPVTTASAHD